MVNAKIEKMKKKIKKKLFVNLREIIIRFKISKDFLDYSKKYIDITCV